MTLREVAERSLDDEIRELEEELAGFDFERVRESTLERRLEAFEQLRNRAALFAGVLAFKADGLSQRVSAMQAQVRQHLGIEPLPTPEPVTAPDSSRPSTAPVVPFAADVGF